MAGPRTAQLLEARSYEAFAQLVHALSELIIAPLAQIDGCAHLVAVMAQRAPGGADAALERAAADLRATARQGMADTRSLCWPDGSRHGPTTEARWAPYDGQAWDRLFDEAGAMLRPRRAELDVGLGQIQAAAGPEAPWREALTVAFRAYQQLEEALTVAGFEARVAQGRPARG